MIIGNALVLSEKCINCPFIEDCDTVEYEEIEQEFEELLEYNPDPDIEQKIIQALKKLDFEEDN